MSRTVLLVSQRPSDYVEMKRCALALAERGHKIQFVYHQMYEGDAADRPILEEMDALQKTGVLARARVVVDESPRIRLRKKRKEKKQKPVKPSKPPLPPKQLSLPRLIIGHGWNLIMRVWGLIVRVTRRLYSLGLRVLSLAIRIASRVLSRAIDLAKQIAIRMPYIVMLYLRRRRLYIALLQQYRPDIIILPEDVVGLVTPLMIKAGHVNDIPSLIVPYTIANQQEAFRSLRAYPNLNYYHWFNWPIAMFLPSWVMREDGQAVIRLPVMHILGHVATRASPPDPWMMNSGYANAIAVENQSMHEYYRSSGIPESKMRVVGAVYDDALASILLNKETELAKVREELGIANDKPLLLIGGCPDQSGSCPGFEFSDMSEFLEKLAQGVADLSDAYQIVVRPHPNYLVFGDMLRERGILATLIDTARLVPVSDAYIAFGSATIRWAVSCGIPTINYDVFRYDYSDFKGVGGVLNVASYDAFLEALTALKPGTAQLASLVAKARAEAPRWGTLDGKSVDRIEALIEELCSVKPVPRTAA